MSQFIIEVIPSMKLNELSSHHVSTLRTLRRSTRYLPWTSEGKLEK